MTYIAKAFLDFLASDLFAIIFVLFLVSGAAVLMWIALDDMRRR